MHQLSSTNKLVDWQGRLLTTIEELSETPFSWGENDCCIFAAKCIDAQYGTTIAQDVVGKYNSELSCKRYMLKRAKSTNITTVLDSFLTRREHKNFAQRGDVVVFEGALGPTAGILWINHVYAMGPGGVEVFPLHRIEITDIWRA